MSNIIEALWNTMKEKLDNEPKSPLHVIEVGDLWRYYNTDEFQHYDEMALNTSVDDEIIEMVNDALKLCKGQSKRLTSFMTQEGIPLPTTSADKPKSNPDDIPLGAKMTDDEIANGVVFKLVTMIQLSAKAQADAIRSDVGLMWLEIYAECVTFGATAKTLLKKRGWLKVPPYYYPPGNPNKD